MNKGLIRTIEAFIAVYLLSMFLASIQIVSMPRYEDPYNIERLQRNSEHISLSICNNHFHREGIIEEGRIPENINTARMLPKDLEANVKLYNGTFFNKLIDKTGNFSEETTIATSSCIVTTHDQNIIEIGKTGEENIIIGEDENETIEFDVQENERGYKNTLVIEANQTDSGETVILVQNETEKIEAGSLSFSQTGFEKKTLNLTNYLPDAENEYKVTVKPDVETDYSHIGLDISKIESNYKPYKVLVGVWNK
ncbi:MAG: hypothetical protein ACOCTT_00470 [archaeon]